jgi:peroxiredoxin
VLTDRLALTPDEIHRRSGWEIKPEGACRGDAYIPLPDDVTTPDGLVDVVALAAQLAMPMAHDEAHGLWAFGPPAGGKVLDSVDLPDLELQDFDGNPVTIGGKPGKKTVVVAWASWCGCRLDLPAWQALHEELAPAGVEIVTVALDADPEAARQPHEDARPTHPSLVDPSFRLVERFGITNVPFGIWVDEDGTIVRPAEPASVPRDPDAPNPTEAAMAMMPEEHRATIAAMGATAGDMSLYTDAVRDWAAKGAESRYVLPADEVIERSRPSDHDTALAAAEFELGQHLHRTGSGQDAVPHFKRAHELDPTNWSYQRQARSLADPAWGQVYETDLMTEVRRVGPETWRPLPDM